jgi:tetratricopeptide (TPR) repeat protein
VADNPRIEELRRRVQKDPASIAFAQLAEEYRRSGNYEDAIAACRAGLAIHPGYLSARVTLGRALLEVNDLDAAHAELSYVLKHAPENLAAIRGVAEIHHRRGQLNEALVFYKAALALAKHDPDLEQTVDEISRALTPVVDDGLSFEQASAEFLAALEGLPGGLEAALAPDDATSVSASAVYSAPNAPNAPIAPIAPSAPAAPEEAPALPELERFLDRIHTSRQKKAV